ncbi:MAG TPA: Hsp20/alpha crystallin family protein [Anaerolineales bacterium]|jgi:HSP20 family protein
MSNLIRFEPMREMMTLREAMNQLFDDSFTRPLGLAGGSNEPAIDLYQDSDNVFVKAVLPGVKPEQVQISVTSDVLSLKGEFTHESEQKEVTYHIREKRYGAFERSLRLPAEVQTDKAKAEFENGILTVTLPKAEAVKPKSITIKAK